MNKLLSLKDFGLVGIIGDLKPYEIPQNAFSSGLNYRIVNNTILSYNGSFAVSTPPTNINAGLIVPVFSTGFLFYLLLGLTKAYGYNGTAWGDVTSLAGYAALSSGDELKWNGCQMGLIAIVNNPKSNIEYWNPLSITQILQPLKFDAVNTWAAKGFKCKVIRAHKTFLFALSLTEGATKLPDSYRWSHPADINGLPFSWDETDLASVAGKASVGEGGELMDGLTLRNSFALYSNQAVHLLDEIPSELIFSKRKLSSNFGLAATNALTSAISNHYFLTDGDILVNDGNSLKSILTNKLKKKLASGLDALTIGNSYAVTNPVAKEVWVCVPEIGHDLPNLAYIYNWEFDSVSLREIPANISRLAYGKTLVNPGTLTSAVTWASSSGNWTAQRYGWGGLGDPTFFLNGLLSSNNSTSAVRSLIKDDQSAPLNTLLERIGLQLESIEQVSTIVRVYPHISSPGNVSFQFGSQMFPNDNVTWQSPVTFTPNTQRKIDLLITGMLFSFRVLSVGSNSFEFTGIDFEYVNNGAR